MKRSMIAWLLALLPLLAAAAPEDGEPPLAGLGGPIDLVDQGGHSFHLAQLGRRRALVFSHNRIVRELDGDALTTAALIRAASVSEAA